MDRGVSGLRSFAARQGGPAGGRATDDWSRGWWPRKDPCGAVRRLRGQRIIGAAWGQFGVRTQSLNNICSGFPRFVSPIR